MNMSPLSSLSYFTQEICGFTTIIASFSKEDVHHPGLSINRKWTFASGLPATFKISLDVYANGNSDKNKGFVSLFIRLSERPSREPTYPSFTTSIVISVLDMDGNQRFPQSATLTTVSCDDLDKLSIDRFVERKTLLSQDSELLHYDQLIVYVDFYSTHCVRHNDQFDRTLLNFSDSLNGETKDCVKLNLNSHLVQLLAQESEFFRSLSHTKMRETDTGYIEVNWEEFYHLECFGRLLKRHFDGVFDVSYVCELYRTAHKYGIEIVLRACREFITTYLSYEIIDEISEFANDYEDDDLKGRVKEISETTKYTRNVESDSVSTSGSPKELWETEKFGSLYTSNLGKEENAPDFDFYK